MRIFFALLWLATLGTGISIGYVWFGQEDVVCQIRAEMIEQYVRLIAVCSSEIRLYKEMGDDCQKFLDTTRAINHNQRIMAKHPRKMHGIGGQ